MPALSYTEVEMSIIENSIGLQLEDILVATNFDQQSEMITTYAQAWAKRYSSKLTVLHVVDLALATLSGAAVVGLMVEAEREKSNDKMEYILHELKVAGIRSEGKILEAHNPASAIVSLAEEIHAALIVMGTHARHGLNKWIQGSCGEGVIHHAKCPVLLLGPKVRQEKMHDLRINSIIFATDLDHDSAEKAAVALTFAMGYVANIYMCHVLKHAEKDFGSSVERQLQTESALRRLIPDSNYEWCSPEVIVEHGRVGEHIVELAQRKKADLIVMGARRSANWLLHLKEDVSSHVLGEVVCPVMTICTD
jgi:nucleotide-binding universal stress UspA family protein